MTDRIKGFTITLEKDVRVDDVQPLIQAISMLKGIAHVEPSLSTCEDHMNREMIAHEFKMKLYNFLKEELK